MNTSYSICSGSELLAVVTFDSKRSLSAFEAREQTTGLRLYIWSRVFVNGPVHRGLFVCRVCLSVIMCVTFSQRYVRFGWGAWLCDDSRSSSRATTTHFVLITMLNADNKWNIYCEEENIFVNNRAYIFFSKGCVYNGT